MSTETKRTIKWGRIVLVISLALNLAVVGIVAGAALKMGGGKHAARFDLGVGPIARAFSAEDRDAIRDRLREDGGSRIVDRQGLRDDMQAIIVILKAEQFDAEAFRALVARQQDRLQTGQDAVITAVAVQIESMDADARVAFADRLEEQLRRGPGNRDN